MPTQDYPLPGPRIIIVGVTGAGKTTLAQQLSGILNIPCIELDAIHWQPNWVMMETEAFRQKVSELTVADRWVIDGNYRKASDIFWSRATTLVWLDYSFLVSFWQLFRRTMRRLIRNEVLWNGNRETWKLTFFSKESLFLWSVQSYPTIRKSYPELLAQPENAHLQVIRLHRPGETRRWLQSIREQINNQGLSGNH